MIDIKRHIFLVVNLDIFLLKSIMLQISHTVRMFESYNLPSLFLLLLMLLLVETKPILI